MSTSPGSGVRGPEISACSKYYHVEKRRLHSIQGATLPKIRVTRKKLQIKGVRN